MNSQKLQYLKNLFQIGGFFFTGLSIFFIAGFLVIFFRVSVKPKVEVPNVVGSLYLDVHNQLVNEKGFEVVIEKRNSLEYPYGFILSQSISGGEIAKQGDRLTLLVNNSDFILKTPDFVGISIDLVPEILQAIPVGNRTFSLRLGMITRIPSTEKKGTVLAQAPPEGTAVRPDSIVNVLVSNGPDHLKQNAENFLLKGSDIEIIKAIAWEIGIPVKMYVHDTNKLAEHGKLIKVDWKITGTWKKPMGSWSVFVGRAFKNTNQYPFDYQWLTPDYFSDAESFTLAILGKSGMRRFAFISRDSEIVPFFVTGQTEVRVWEGLFDKPKKASEIISLFQNSRGNNSKKKEIEQIKEFSLVEVNVL